MTALSRYNMSRLFPSVRREPRFSVGRGVRYLLLGEILHLYVVHGMQSTIRHVARTGMFPLKACSSSSCDACLPHMFMHVPYI